MQMGRHVARIIRDELELGRDHAVRTPFSYFDKGTMATIGRSRAVALIQCIRLHGFVAWMAWLFIHLLFLIGLRNKLAVLLNWTYAYFAYRPGARIITSAPPAEDTKFASTPGPITAADSPKVPEVSVR
jgi:NADH dehydrogenase